MKASLSMRVWFVFMGVILWTGIYFTGFSTVNWLLYLSATALVLAGITGICPSQRAIFKLLGVKKKKAPLNN